MTSTGLCRPLKHGRISRLCVAVDTTDASDGVAKLAISLVRGNYHAEIDFLHVVNTQRMIAHADRSLDDYGSSFELAREAAHIVLTGCSLLAQQAGVFARSYVRFGDPATESATFARVRGADVVVIGNRPTDKLQRLLNGSTRDDMVRRCPLPLLLAPAAAREADDFEPRCIIVAGADSPGGRSAKRLAADLAADYASQLVVLPLGSGGAAAEKNGIEAAIREHAAGLIVMTNTRRKRFQNLFSDDLVERVMHAAQLPVLVVRADDVDAIRTR